MTGATNAARRLERRIEKAGYIARVQNHGYAVKIFTPDEVEVCVLWLPVHEPTPTGLGDKYLWGRRGAEHQADDSTPVDEIAQMVLRTLPKVAA